MRTALSHRSMFGGAWRRGACALIAMIIGVALSPQAAQAADVKSRAKGGPGGAAYEMRCAQGDYLVGLAAKSGNWVDAVAPLCAAWDGKAKSFLPPGTGPLKGGTGGGPVANISCDPVSVVTSLFVEEAQNEQRTVGFLSLQCSAALTGKRTRVATRLERFGKSISELTPEDPNVGTSAVPLYPSDAMPQCAKGAVAVGIHGGAGKYVDRIGLICAPAPRAVADPVVTPKPFTPPIRPNAADMARIPARPVAADPATCKSGFVWRDARPGDAVCVTPESRSVARSENAAAATRVNPAGAYGPNTCISGFVWREAFDGDVVCVTPERRDAVRAENDAAASRRITP